MKILQTLIMIALVLTSIIPVGTSDVQPLLVEDTIKYVDYGQEFIADSLVNIEWDYLLAVQGYEFPDCDESSYCPEGALFNFYRLETEEADYESTIGKPLHYLEEGERKEILGVFVEYHGNRRFVVLRNEPYNTVEVEVHPQTVTVERGEWAYYEMTVKDTRKTIHVYPGDPEMKEYRIRVGSPFYESHPNEVNLYPGQEETFTVGILTSDEVIVEPEPAPEPTPYSAEVNVGIAIPEPTSEAVEIDPIVKENRGSRPTYATAQAIEDYAVPEPPPDSVIVDPVGVSRYEIKFIAEEKFNPANNDVGYADLYVTYHPSRDVDVHISPDIRFVNRGEVAEYSVTIKDNHPSIGCPVGPGPEVCPIRLYGYEIEVGDLPFYTEYPSLIHIEAGGEETFALNVDTSVIRVTVGDETKSWEDEDMPPHYNYNFNVIARGDDSKGQDNAKLRVEYHSDYYRIDLERGWNLVSVPPKEIVRFVERDGSDQNFVGYVWYKEEQRYLTMQQAEEEFGTEGAKRYLERNGFWIYTPQDDYIEIIMEGEVPLEEITLVDGWNIIATPYRDGAYGRDFSEIAQGCDLESIWIWEGGYWSELDFDFEIDGNYRNRGILIHNGNHCRLGVDDINPPPLPY
ncbi:hypothetical protein ACFLZX_06090 [Nanoarchaeota archaeon]